MKKAILTFVIILIGFLSQAQIPNGYYNSANGKTGDELKVALHNIIKGHSEVSYSGLLDAYAYTDCDANGKIWDIYSNYHYELNQNGSSFPNEGAGWNREHTWPQSWFNEKSTPRTDLFHVYPTDGYVNAQRSSYPYGEVNNPTYTSGNGSKLGPCATSGYSGTVFEPIDEFKGDIARSYFYMSVRYYDEDSDWRTSGMTNKSEIKTWAMTMLLRWSDEDPVSQKEIDRNNAVYGYQNNRNPFIDHPEYARMIWDPNWQGGVSYLITCTTGLPHGSISAPENAMEGTTVSINATPDPGYMVDTYSVCKTGSPSTTIPVNSNGTFTMPNYAVTVSASFIVNNTSYNIALGSVSHGSISASASSANSGATINLTATPATGYSLYSWYVFKTGDLNTRVSVSGNSFVMPAFNVTVMATFVQDNTNSNYVKVTNALSDWSGDYILVYENSATSGYVWTGVDAENCYAEKTISNNAIANDGMVSITIASMTGGYSIKVNGGTNDGKYIYGKSGENKLSFGNSPALNTITYESNSIKIVNNTSVLRFNNSNDQKRFRYFKSDTYSNQQVIQIFKKTFPTQTHTIYFNKNNGTGSMNNQTVNEFEASTLTSNTFTREGFVFDGWNTQADGSGTYYADGTTVRLLDDLTLYAQWNPLFTISTAMVAHGSIITDHTSAVEETTITLTATPDTEYEFGQWIVKDALDHDITVTENQFEMPASDVTVSAIFNYVEPTIAHQYELVTSTNQLIAGKTYLIVNTAAGKALGTTQNNKNRSATDVTINNGVISTIENTVCQLTLGGSSGAWTFFDAGWGNSGGYLYAASSSDNYLKTQASNNTNGQWSISIDSDGTATIVAQGSNTRNNLRYNTSGLFSCYASDASLTQMPLVSLFVLTDVFDKNIEGYGTGNGGWYTIASPFSDLTPSQLAKGHYDLYAFDESADLEWINYKAHKNDFVITPGKGYLYAHQTDTILHLTGTQNSTSFTATIDLSYANANTSIRGFNLLGNPTAHTITFTKTENVSDGYYYLNNSETWEYETGNSIPVGRGFLVKANAENQTVTLNPQTRGEANDAYLCVKIDDDKAYVKMNEGVSMPLFALNGKNPRLSINHEGKRYIMLVRDDVHHINLNYQPSRTGQHTFSVDAEGLNLDYLHLVDHLTGADVDMLAIPIYSFESHSTDYSARFQLRFSPIEKEAEEEDFAFINNGEIIISGEGMVQVIDMLGRIIINRDATHSISTSEFKPGVYVLRLTTPEKTRIQKIAIY